MLGEKAKTVCLALGIVFSLEEVAHLQSARPSGPYTITLAWDPPEEGEPATYIIEAGSRPGRSDVTVFETPATAEPILVVAGVPAGTYFVRVRARNSGGVSEPSNEIVVNLGNAYCFVPVAPVGLTSTTSDGIVTLRWIGSPGATSYELEAGSSPGVSDLFRGDIGDSTTLVAYAPPATVFVRVRAKNSCGVSPPSNEAPAG
jgi:Fibronectin type III domain